MGIFGKLFGPNIKDLEHARDIDGLFAIARQPGAKAVEAVSAIGRLGADDGSRILQAIVDDAAIAERVRSNARDILQRFERDRASLEAARQADRWAAELEAGRPRGATNIAGFCTGIDVGESWNVGLGATFSARRLGTLGSDGAAVVARDHLRRKFNIERKWSIGRDVPVAAGRSITFAELAPRAKVEEVWVVVMDVREVMGVGFVVA